MSFVNIMTHFGMPYVDVCVWGSVQVVQRFGTPAVLCNKEDIKSLLQDLLRYQDIVPNYLF